MLLSAAACSKTPKTDELTLSVPESESVTYVQDSPIDITAWANAEAENQPTLSRETKELTAGGTATLLSFSSEENPVFNGDELTSITDSLILNSAGVPLGDGTIQDLAENELYRWDENAGFDAVQYSPPTKISDSKYVVHLTLTSENASMEQMVFYTDLGKGMARIDRLWRVEKEVEESSEKATFEAVANALLVES